MSADWKPIKIALLSEGTRSAVQHYVGMSKELDLTSSQTALPPPHILVAVEDRIGFFLYRFSVSGEFAGDTWHPTLHELIEQATYEFGLPAGAWSDWERIDDNLKQAYMLLLSTQRPK
ncbi:MAG: hypothetical protein RMK49_20070 [Abditibacteriales bacterium]|nr:hypothetical protein [Abditibacteriales bacterium]